MAVKPEAWVVRADKPIANKVEKTSRVAIGWVQMGDLYALKTKEEFQGKYQTIFGATGSKMQTGANQLYRFVIEIQRKDYVITPLSASREILIGTVTGDYSYDPLAVSTGYPNVRAVTWLKKISRDILSPKLRGSSGSIMTVFNISKYLSEIENFLDKK